MARERSACHRPNAPMTGLAEQTQIQAVMHARWDESTSYDMPRRFRSTGLRDDPFLPSIAQTALSLWEDESDSARKLSIIRSRRLLHTCRGRDVGEASCADLLPLLSLHSATPSAIPWRGEAFGLAFKSIPSPVPVLDLVLLSLSLPHPGAHRRGVREDPANLFF